MLKKFSLLLCTVLAVSVGFAQKSSAGFSTDSLELLIHRGINAMRMQQGFDTLVSNAVLQKASEFQATYMAKNEKAELQGPGKKYRDTGSRLKTFGGSKKGEEIIYAVSVSKGKEFSSAKAAAEIVLKKWKDSKKEKTILVNGSYILSGLSAKMDDKSKKVYVSAIFADYDLVNDGAKKKSELKVPFSSKNKRIKPPTPQACKNCAKFKDYDSLREGLYINEEGYICMKYSNLKLLKKILKGPKDGFAIDIVQRAQYEKQNYNILDNNLLTKGTQTKPIYSEKLFKNNLSHYKAKSKGSHTKSEETFNAKIAKFPKTITGSYELNLLIIQDGQLCKTVRHTYLETGSQKGSPVTMLLMPDSTAYLKPVFKPQAESGLLTFKIPFEKNKSTYREEDMLPFLNALQEPDFSIEGVYLTAYSSIEGDSAANTGLQKSRAKSIIEALGRQQKKSNLLTNIQTKDSWLLFTMEMEEGKYDYLTKMSKNKAIHLINTKPGLADSLEPVLNKERFAQVVLDVTYDIQGPKEERFCVLKFNSAVKKKDIRQAEKIQYYIQKNVREGRFTQEALSKSEIPFEPAYSGLLMNKVVYSCLANKGNFTPEQSAELKKIAALDPKNGYALYNSLYCSINEEALNNPAKINELQGKLDGLSVSGLFPSKQANALNTEFQFRIMDAADTLEGAEAIIDKCIGKIKSYYNLKDANWQNSLKLAYAFMKHREFLYSARLLEPFVGNPKVNEELLFTYLAACSNSPELICSRPFAAAMNKAHQVNPDRYCKLFGEPNMSFQVLDIPQVKEDYFKNGCSGQGN